MTLVERLHACKFGLFWPEARDAIAEIERLEKALETVREALEQFNCPRPYSGRPDDFTVGQCFGAGECGCLVPGTLSQKKEG